MIKHEGNIQILERRIFLLVIIAVTLVVFMIWGFVHMYFWIKRMKQKLLACIDENHKILTRVTEQARDDTVTINQITRTLQELMDESLKELNLP